jgi:hypothetical protein
MLMQARKRNEVQRKSMRVRVAHAVIWFFIGPFQKAKNG